jgi:hypothetical protein
MDLLLFQYASTCKYVLGPCKGCELMRSRYLEALQAHRMALLFSESLSSSR